MINYTNDERIQRNLYFCSQNLQSISAVLRMMLTLQLVRTRMDIAGLLHAGLDQSAVSTIQGFSDEVDQIGKDLQEQLRRYDRSTQPSYTEELSRRFGNGH